MDGFLLVDKAAGMTSHDVVMIARKKLETRKVGHAGTLDPLATGVLVLGVGVATRLLTYITDGKKGYQATITLGSATHTDDKDGSVISTAGAQAIEKVNNNAISSELAKFVGQIKQRPSSVSAIKINGKSAHARVRAGERVMLQHRDVTIDELKISDIRRTPIGIEVDLSVICSAGTYIRSIARDLGEGLKIGGHLSSLRRTLVSPFTVQECYPIAAAPLISIPWVIEKLFPIRKLDPAQGREIKFGRVIDQNEQSGIVAALDSQNNFLALLENKLRGSQVVASPILVKATE
jgi:tRNA pseudouridine55 synthase